MPFRNAAIALAVAISAAGSSAQDGETPPRLTVFNDQQHVAWWQTHPDPTEWRGAGVGEMVAALRHAEERYGVERVFENRHFVEWLVHARWLSLFPADPDSDDAFAGESLRDTFRQLSLRDSQRLPGLLVRSLDPADDAEAALAALCRIAAAEPAGVHRYPNLAVALAVVFDQPFPDNWPHPFVNKADLPSPPEAFDAAARFTFCLQSIAAGRFLLDPAKLSVRELTFVVDSPLSLDEWRYAQQVVLTRGPATLGELYPAIRYDTPRANRGDFLWPHGLYSLYEIGRRGGICADQAHFVAQTGKSQGIPTLFFFGQGRSGGHAWAGYLKRPGRWELDVARYGEEKYPVGVAWDPQSWRRITDAQFRLLVKDLAANQRYEMMQLILQWAELNRDRPTYPSLLREARKFMPRYLSTWELEAAWMNERDAPMDSRKRFWLEWITNFRDETDLRIRGQVALLGLHRAAGEDRDAERLERDIQLENKSERFDLAITVAAGSLLALVDRGDWGAAQRDYESALKRFRSSSGGHLFYNLAQPYIERCLEAGRKAEASAALGELIQVIEAAPNSLLDQDVKELQRIVAAVAR